VPSAFDDVVIPAVTTNNPTISTAGAANKIIIQTGGVLTVAPEGSLTLNSSYNSSSNPPLLENNGSVHNNGTISANAFGAIFVVVGAPPPIYYGISNSGTFNNNACGTVTSSNSINNPKWRNLYQRRGFLEHWKLSCQCRHLYQQRHHPVSVWQSDTERDERRNHRCANFRNGRYFPCAFARHDGGFRHCFNLVFG
jgi:hypothetical protein